MFRRKTAHKHEFGKSDNSLQEEVYHWLKRLILLNEFLPGEEFSIERIAQELGVSPTPIREALPKLESEGLVELSRNKQAKVTEITEKDVREAYEIRRFIEPSVAQKATETVSKQKLKDLKHKVENLFSSEIEHKHEVFHKVDIELNKLLYKELENELLDSVMSTIKNKSLRIRFLAESVNQEEEKKCIEEGNDEHLKILKALLDRDQGKVKKTIEDHLFNAERRTMKTMEKINRERDRIIDIEQYI